MRLGVRRPRQFPAVTSTAARVAASVLGLALLVAGAVAVFVTANSVGSAALIAAGAFIVAVALFADQLESFEGGGVKIQLGAVASKLEEACRADAAGDTEGAAELRAEAQLLFAAMEPIAAQYEAIRESSPYGRKRTKGMSDLVHQAQHIAKLDFVNSDAVEQLFNSNQDGTRIMALGLMRGEPRFANPSILVRVIRQPRSSFEQWHALRVAEDLVARQGMSSDELEAIREAIAVAERNGTLLTGTDSSRLKLAERILAAMPADRRRGGAQ